jgi:hypothetical protein
MLTATGLMSANPALAAIVPDTSVNITLGGSNMCLVPRGDGPAWTLRCDIWDDDGLPDNPFAGNFKVVHRSSHNYQIVDTESGKCARLEKTSTDNGVAVRFSTCNGDLTGLWKIVPVSGRPTFRLASAHSGKCMSGTLVTQQPCGTTATSSDQVMFPPTTSYDPTSQPATPYQPVVGVQTTSSAAIPPIIYSYVDNIQRLRIGTQETPATGTVDWTTAAGGFSFTGQPQLAAQKNGKVQLLTRDADTGDVWLQDQTGTGTSGFGAVQDVGGAVSTQPVIGTDPVDGHLVVFTLVNGGLWHLPEAVNNPSAPYGAWRFVGGSGLIGTPTVVSLLDHIQVFALNAAGHLHTASYQAGKLSDWTNLGGPVLNGTPSVVVYPGFWTRVFGRTADGTIVTRKQNNDGTWTADWTSVGDFKGAGSPSAVLDPTSGRTGVVVRGTDRNIYFVNETGQLTGQWGSSQVICKDNNGVPIIADTDPVIFPFKKASDAPNPDGTPKVLQTWGFAVRGGDNVGSACWVESFGGSSAAQARSAQAQPKFSQQEIPLPK